MSMEELNRFQKGLLVILVIMALVFGAIYAVVSARVGFRYQDEILVPGTENGNTVYSGKIRGQVAEFTVSPDKIVTFRYGEKDYGPYTVTEDPTAVPDHESAERMTGIVITDGDEVLFRGGVLYFGADQSDFHLYDEEGWHNLFTVTAVLSDGTVVDSNGNIVDTMKPSAETILRLIKGPELVKKGTWLGWIGGVLASVFAAVSILFADAMFRWRFWFLVRDPYQVEPSDWAIAERYIGWSLMAAMAFALYIIGLR